MDSILLWRPDKRIHRDIKVNVKIVSLWLIKMSFAEFKLIIVRSMEIFSWVATDP